jgi:2',3'-cyclic-nucleotide 2'-phosphodiesterase (5'-nucleotidase family)
LKVKTGRQYVTKDIPDNNEMEALVDKFNQIQQGKLSKVIAITTVPWNTKEDFIRTQESPLGEYYLH